MRIKQKMEPLGEDVATQGATGLHRVPHDFAKKYNFKFSVQCSVSVCMPDSRREENKQSIDEPSLACKKNMPSASKKTVSRVPTTRDPQNFEMKSLRKPCIDLLQ